MSVFVVVGYFVCLLVFVDVCTNYITKFLSYMPPCSVILPTNESWLKQDLWASEPFVANSDDLSIWELIGLLSHRGGTSHAHFLFEIHGTVTQFLFDVSDYFFLS